MRDNTLEDTLIAVKVITHLACSHLGDRKGLPWLAGSTIFLCAMASKRRMYSKDFTWLCFLFLVVFLFFSARCFFSARFMFHTAALLPQVRLCTVVILFTSLSCLNPRGCIRLQMVQWTGYAIHVHFSLHLLLPADVLCVAPLHVIQGDARASFR